MASHAEIIDQKNLTNTEANVLIFLCEGCWSRQNIADKLLRSYGTISKHIESIQSKLGTHSAAHTVSLAVAKGIVRIVWLDNDKAR